VPGERGDRRHLGAARERDRHAALDRADHEAGGRGEHGVAHQPERVERVVGRVTSGDLAGGQPLVDDRSLGSKGFAGSDEETAGRSPSAVRTPSAVVVPPGIVSATRSSRSSSASTSSPSDAFVRLSTISGTSPRAASKIAAASGTGSGSHVAAGRGTRVEDLRPRRGRRDREAGVDPDELEPDELAHGSGDDRGVGQPEGLTGTTESGAGRPSATISMSALGVCFRSSGSAPAALIPSIAAVAVVPATTARVTSVTPYLRLVAPIGRVFGSVDRVYHPFGR